jgi:hypothetical protein
MGDETARMSVRYLGGPTALLELGGLRLLTDPTFDPPGDYPIGNRSLRKTSGAVVSPEDVGRVDAVLLSHDQHPDNLDHQGRDYLASAPLVLSTVAPGQLKVLPVLQCPDRAAQALLRGDGGQHQRSGGEVVAPLVVEVIGVLVV